MSLLTPGQRELNVSHVTCRIGDAEHRETGLFELTLLLRVLALRARASVPRTVDLDDEPLPRPVEVDFNAEQRRVHARLGRRFGQTCEKCVLQPALRAGAAVAVQRDCSLEDVQLAATVRALHGVAGRGLDEAPAERGLVDDVRELVSGQDVGEVHERAGHRGHGNATVARRVAWMEVRRMVYETPWRVVPRCGHDSDKGSGEPRDLAELRRAQVAKGRARTACQNRREALRLP